MADETTTESVAGTERAEPTATMGPGAAMHAGRTLRTSVSNPRRTRL